MPANLTPEYHRAEEHFRQAKTVEDKILALEEMLRVIPKHKGTDHMQADLRGRIAKLRRESTKQGGGHAGFSRVIPREGAGQVALIGPPNSGKSLLVATLTRATPTVADYPFTTTEPTPGMMTFENLQFQLVDLPPLSSLHVEHFVFDLVRHADLAWVVLDGREVLEGFEEVRRLLEPKRIELVPALGGPPAAATDGWRTVRKSLLVLTHADDDQVAGAVEAVDDLLERRWPLVPVSAVSGAGLGLLRRRTFEAFDVIRVYTKQPGKPADRVPFALPRGATVGDLAERIHKDLLAEMRYARIWGPSAFDGQTVQRDHQLAEGDTVEIH